MHKTFSSTNGARCMHAYCHTRFFATLWTSPPGSSVQGISQARVLEWVAISSSRESSRPRARTHISYFAGRFFMLSHLGIPKCKRMKLDPSFTTHCCCLVTKSCPTFVTPWTVACQLPLSMGFPRQEDWSGLPFPSPGDLPDPGSNPNLLLGRWILYLRATWKHVLCCS